MRTPKEIARYVKADALRHGVKLGWRDSAQKNALISICSVKEIQHDIALELKDIVKDVNNFSRRLDVLEEKIRTAPDDDKQQMRQYATEVKKIVGELDFYNIDFEDFTVLDRLLAMLDASLKGYHRRKNWAEINKVANELKLAKLIKSNKAATEIGNILKRSLEEKYSANFDTHGAGEAYEQEREQLKKVYETARSLAPRAETTEDDIIRRIRGKGTDATDVIATTTNITSEKRASSFA